MEDTKVKIKTGWNLDNSYANLPKKFFSKQNPTPVRGPELVILNHKLATSLGLNIEYLESKDGIEVFSGNKIPEGSLPLAQAYAGHQFGYFNMLGDGRAILLGEQITPSEDRYDIQLKGSGRTPYSRGGDGRAALGPMLREYIISEAMKGLGIPTTRSLAVVKTGELVFRETELQGAILTRVAASHIRVATFQYAAEYGGFEEIKALADYTIKRHFSDGYSDENPYLFLLKEVIKRQASLIAKWQLVGFIHGVMNTDNVSICGETIDYGPCAFMDTYDPETVFSSIDREGRYAYGNQPYIGGWNLSRFAETLLPLISDNQDKAVELAQDAVSDFADLYKNNWLSGMRAKLGLFNEEAEDESLIYALLNMMKEYNADYTNSFNALTFERFTDIDMFKTNAFTEWYEVWKERKGRQHESKDYSHALMKSFNPAIIPRNHRVEEALEAAEHGDYRVMTKLLNVLSNPYAHTLEQFDYAALPPKSSCRYRTFCGT
ncbi:YdiU family protein [Clostridium sp.]|uniref:protein adenylyltransferase SelO n=1 Tax=Clostridium sp. TaxID=1506 RepID=UPI00262161E0|nr:YdiU family protein [Clostridium sp.]